MELLNADAPARAYLTTLATLEAARRTLKALTPVIADVALRIMEWTRRTDDTVRPLLAVAWENWNLTVNKDAWPCADELASAVDAFHSARAEAVAAYDALPADYQQGLAPPR